MLPPDELPAATGTKTVRSDRGSDGRFTRGNTAARARRLRAGPLGGVGGIDSTSDAFKPFARWGRRYGAHRRRELAAAHGGAISAGVGALIESGALALASSRYLQNQGAATGDPELLKRASSLAAEARQNELAAWELAAREAKARGASRRTALDRVRERAAGRLNPHAEGDGET
ncbi:hypothetical protein WMF37_42760 [Sorangium sp. So ce291]|uniref:hypothetical protein n=1 Tax=Sorangium sp. So ce291 TaxID=3133294 RepID=UPI003F5DD976